MTKNQKIKFIFFLLLASHSTDSLAQDGQATPAFLSPRIDLHARFANDRNLGGSEFWLPLHWEDNWLTYADIRLSDDDHENQEGNFGLGTRKLLPAYDSIFGVYGFLDRRKSTTGNFFTQGTAGAEFLTPDFDLRANAYIPLSSQKTLQQGSQISFALAGTELTADRRTLMRAEKSLTGADIEAGWRISLLQKTALAETRLYAAAFHFGAPGVSAMNGYRYRVRTRPWKWLELGAGRQYDNIRGFSEFADVRLRIPFNGFSSGDTDGDAISSRLDEEVVRDIDIVTRQNDSVSDTGPLPVVNGATGTRQKIYTVDNSAPSGGDGSTVTPWNSLAAAQAAAGTGDIIYVRRGDGTTAGMDQGITLAHDGQKLIGSAAPLTIDLSGRKLGNTGETLAQSVTLKPAVDSGPVITNTGGDGVTVTGNNVAVGGLTIDGAAGNGLYALNADRLGVYNITTANNAGDGVRVEAGGAGNRSLNDSIRSVASYGNDNGIRFYAADDASLSASVSNTAATANRQHGFVIYDDSNAGTVEVDMGGGAFSSPGRNTITGNTLEDLALDIDGNTLHARNNWWGQAGGPQARQVYLGAPLDDNLAANWRFDESSGTTAADRTGGNDATLNNNAAWDPTSGQHNGAIQLQAIQDSYVDASSTIGNSGSHMTVSYWINPSTVQPTATQVAKWDFNNSGASSWGVRAANASGTELYVFISADNTDGGDNFFQTSNANLTPGVWANITFVYDGTGATNADRLKVYKDGVQLNGSFSGIIAPQLNSSAQPVTIGRQLVSNPAYAQPFDGSIDDVRIYNQSLSSNTIDELVRMNTASGLDNGSPLLTAP